MRLRCEECEKLQRTLGLAATCPKCMESYSQQHKAASEMWKCAAKATGTEMDQLAKERDEARELVRRAWNFKAFEDAAESMQRDFDRAVKRWDGEK